MLEDGTALCIDSTEIVLGIEYISGRKFVNCKDFFSKPFSSQMYLNVFVGELSTTAEKYLLTTLRSKCMILPLPLKSEFLIYPILHFTQ